MHTLTIVSWLANMQLRTQIHGKMQLQSEHWSCAYSDHCLMACKYAIAYIDTWTDAAAVTTFDSFLAKVQLHMQIHGVT